MPGCKSIRPTWSLQGHLQSPCSPAAPGLPRRPSCWSPGESVSVLQVGSCRVSEGLYLLRLLTSLLSQPTACMTASSSPLYAVRQFSAACRLRTLLAPLWAHLATLTCPCQCADLMTHLVMPPARYQAVQCRPAGCMLRKHANNCTPPRKCASLTPDAKLALKSATAGLWLLELLSSQVKGSACSPLPEPGLGANTTAAWRGASGEALNQTLQGHEQLVSHSGPVRGT